MTGHYTGQAAQANPLRTEAPADIIQNLSAQASVKKAAENGERLESLWPLANRTQLDNDVKYNETLRVRQTREFAQLLVRDCDVTVADAEYVYEGAEEIPGRPQQAVDALILANDIYDDTAEFSENPDPAVFRTVIARMGSPFNDGDRDALDTAIDECEALMENISRSESRSFAQRFAVSLYAYTQVRQCVAGFTLDDTARTVAVLFVNEFNEQWSLPRIFVKYEYLMVPFMHPQESWDALSLAAADEWEKHTSDILWDPVEAKRIAREEDEKKSRAALAEKFEHVRDDPGKPEVEL